MSRKTRRAGLKTQGISAGNAAAEGIEGAAAAAERVAEANWYFRSGRAAHAQDICHQILSRHPRHVHALNLLGLILQASGRHKSAVKVLKEAIGADGFNAACHYNIASSYHSLDRPNEAEFHFHKAISFGARQNNTETLILQNPLIAAAIGRIEEAWPLPAGAALFAPANLQEIADDIFLRCALTAVPLRGLPLEGFLTALRAALLALADPAKGGAVTIAESVVRLFCALAQQCFINEYVFAESERERRRSQQLVEVLRQRSSDGDEISPLLLAAVAAYRPLHSLHMDGALLSRTWPQSTAELVRQQLREPLEEAQDCSAIPVLTPVDDSVSLRVMQQYQENPYPRWTINPLAAFAGDRASDATSAGDGASGAKDILIAGCGSGQHAFEAAQCFPEARVLAVDISLPSLAYARRKTREVGLRNIEYAQADILELGTIGRLFDRIEVVGVLHHLAEPEVGWRLLVSLLRPHGKMRVGLYSEIARRPVNNAHARIAARGYRPTADDIRRCRQELILSYDQSGWRALIEIGDFYSISGCRDMLFNVMEHNFTITRIKAFLNEQRLSFLGFDLDPRTLEKFAARFSGADALTDLDKWQAFEADNPQTFLNMYVFTARKD